MLSSEYAFRHVACSLSGFPSNWNVSVGYPVMQDVLPGIQEESKGSFETGCVSGFPVTHR